MRPFECDSCGNLLFFENVVCLRCQHPLGFAPNLYDLCAFDPIDNTFWKPLSPRAESRRYRRCRNWIEHNICNWMIPEETSHALCRACRLNLVIPDLSVPGNIESWRKLEVAKRRVIYSLIRFQLPLESKAACGPLRFQFLADAPGRPAMTGHANGLITVNIAEADDAERERRRIAMKEPFRTLIGHFRHEIAHYYWEALVQPSPFLDEFRRHFGDERADYRQCLTRHYSAGPPQDWQQQFVSAYATCHPWEDWAESWAHYFHIADLLETAGSFGMSIRPRHPQAATMRAEPQRVLGQNPSFDELLQHWMPLTYVLNELNRGMGLPDLYPFVLSDAAAAKLRFVHDLLRANQTPGEN